MIRFRIGASTQSQAGEDRAHERPVPVALEIDGIDVTGGLLDDPLVPAGLSLIQAVVGLVEGSSRTASVSFGDGAIELILSRHGDRIRISLVSLPRPAQVVARDLEVDLFDLAQAASTFAREVLVHSTAARDPRLASLAAVSRRLERAAAAPGEARPSTGRPFTLRRTPEGGSEVPSIGFDLRDEDGRLGSYESGDGLHPLLAWGHVYLHGPDGEELESLEGPPWLILRDLSDVGFRLLEASRDPSETSFRFPLGHDAPRVEVDLVGGTFTVAGRTLRCPPRSLARALFSGALDLGGVLLARHPALAKNPWLASMMDEARERLALCEELSPTGAVVPVPAHAPRPRSVASGPPLAPGEIRRVILGTRWQRQLDPLKRLHRAGGRIWAVGAHAAVALSWDDGEALGRISYEALATAGATDPLLALDDEGRLHCLEPSGATRWKGPSKGATRLLAEWWSLAHGLGAGVVDGAELILFRKLDGREVFRFVPPAAGRALGVAAGSLFCLAADNGLLYGVDVGREEIGWRLPLGQEVVHLAAVGDRVAAVVDGADGLELLGIDGATGTVTSRLALPYHEVGRLLPFGQGWVLAGVGSAGGELSLVRGSGELGARLRPNLGPSVPQLLVAGGSLYARGSTGVCRIERGKVRWNVPCGPGGVPALARGLLVLPGEGLGLKVSQTGAEPDLSLPRGLPPVDHLLADETHGFVVADTEGSCTRLGLSGALAVVA